MIKKHKGQVIIGLVLLVTVVLTIGLALVQRSLFDISTSTKVEQSQQAFSVAEAGLEKALKEGTLSNVEFSETGAKTVQIQDTAWFPYTQACSSAPCPTQAAVEYPPLYKEEVAHVWLADPESVTNPPALYYNQSSLDIYWGDPNLTTDRAAIQIKVLFFDEFGDYQVKPYYLDPVSTRATSSGFTDVSGSCSSHTTTTIFGEGRNFYCKFTLSVISPLPSPFNLILLRARLLYNTVAQPFAVQATPGCNITGSSACYLPPQSRILVSTGESGQTQRTVQVFQLKKVVPPYFDYAIFSAGEIRK